MNLTTEISLMGECNLCHYQGYDKEYIIPQKIRCSGGYSEQYTLSQMAGFPFSQSKGTQFFNFWVGTLLEVGRYNIFFVRKKKLEVGKKILSFFFRPFGKKKLNICSRKGR